MNQGLGSRVDDTGRAAPRATPGTEGAGPPNLGCLQRAGESWRLTPTTNVRYNKPPCPDRANSPPTSGIVAHVSSPERTGGGEGG